MYVVIYIDPRFHHLNFGGVIMTVPLSDLDDSGQERIRAGEDMTKKEVWFFNPLVETGGWSIGRVIFITSQDQSLIIDGLINDYPPKFNPGDDPSSAENIRAARVRGFSFDCNKQQYIDRGGVPVLDINAEPLF